MNKTIALTFTAAAVLLAASFAVNIYGDYVVESQRRDVPELRIYCDRCDTGLESWERAAGLIGLLSFSLTAAGAMLWHSEEQSMARQISVLGLEEKAARRIVRTPGTWNSVVALEIHVDGSRVPFREEEHLTPLERVIRDS